MDFSSVSLFSGAGGLDLGLEKAGFATRVFVEIDRHAQQTLQENRGFWTHCDTPVLGDVSELTPGDVLAAAGLAKGEATLLAGGPPCQSFSTAGRRGAVSDPRGGLLAHFGTMVAGVRPRFFLFENVRGLLSAAIKHRPLRLRGKDARPLEDDEELGSVLQRVVLPLLRDALGYEVVLGLVNAADYGVPQTRQRVFLLGSRDHELGSDRFTDDKPPLAQLLCPTHSGDKSPGLKKWRTLGDVIQDLDEANPEYTPYTPDRARVLKLIPAGKNWRHLRTVRNEAYLRKVMGGAYDATGGKVGFWRRLSFDRPCPTVTASPIQKGTSLCHPVETRPLSVREYARVQQFPDGFVFAGSTAQKYKQIGNAVPVGLARAIGEALVTVIEANDQQGVGHRNGTDPGTAGQDRGDLQDDGQERLPSSARPHPVHSRR